MASYNYNDAAIVLIGRFDHTYSSGNKSLCHNGGAGCFFKYNGTQAITVHIAVSGANLVKVYFNGVEQTNPTISPTGLANDGTFTLTPTDGDIVLIQCAVGAAYAVALLHTGFIVTQGTDTISLAPGYSKTTEFVKDTNLTTYAIQSNLQSADDVSWENNNFTSPYIARSVFPQANIIFKATVSGLWFVGKTALVGLWVDGVRHSVKTMSGNRIHVVSLATDLDDTQEHTYMIVLAGGRTGNNEVQTSVFIDQIGFIGGTGLNTTSSVTNEIPYNVVFIGDSFEESQGNALESTGPSDTSTSTSQLDGFGVRFSESFPVAVSNYGIAGAQVSQYLTRLSTYTYPSDVRILCVGGLENDGATSQSSVETSLKDIVIAAFAKWPNLQAVVFRPTGSSGATTFANQRTYQQNVVNDLNDPEGSEGTTYNGKVVWPSMSSPPLVTTAAGQTYDWNGTSGQHPNAYGNDIYCDALVAASTSFFGDPPLAPTINTITVNKTAVTLTYTPGDETQDSYQLDISEVSNFSDYDSISLTGVSTSTTIVLGLLKENTLYYFRLKAINEIGSSDYSSIQSITTGSNGVNMNNFLTFDATFYPDTPAVAQDVQLDATRLYDRTGNYYSISSGVLHNTQTAGTQWLTLNKSNFADTLFSYTNLVIEADLEKIDATHLIKFCTHYDGGVTPISCTVYTGWIDFSAPDTTTSSTAYAGVIADEGWRVRFEQTIGVSDIVCRVKIYNLGTGTLLHTSSDFTVSKSAVGLDLTGRPGFNMLEAAGASHKCNVNRVWIWAGTSMGIGVTPIYVTAKTKNTVTLNGGIAHLCSGSETLTLYVNDIYDKTDIGRSLGTYTPGMTVSGLTPSTKYYFTVKVVDGVNSAITNPIMVDTYGRDPVTTGTNKIIIGNIGSSSSIADDDAGNNCIDILARMVSEYYMGTPDSIQVVNKGVGGSTCFTWAQGQANYTDAVTDFNTAGITDLVYFGTGMNDSSAVVTPEDFATYVDNTLQGMINDIPTLKRIWVYHTRWNNNSGTVPEEAEDRIWRYNDYLDSLVDGVLILQGDRTMFDRFKTLGVSYYLGAKDSHPNHDGIQVLGYLMAGPMINYFYNYDKKIPFGANFDPARPTL